MSSLKQDRLAHALAKFEEAYGELELRPGDAVEQAIWSVLARHATKERATRAYNALFKTFIDVNEVRVSKLADLGSAIAEHVRGDPFVVAGKIRGFLRKLWEDRNAVSFEPLRALDLEAQRKYLATLPDFGPELALGVLLKLRETDELVADPHAARVAVRVAAAPASTTAARFKKMLDEEIADPAQRIRILFAYAAHGGETCFPKTPNCAECMLGTWCPAYNPPKRLAAAAKRTKARATKAKKPVARDKRKTAPPAARKTAKRKTMRR